jgi:hypothetical protein
MNACYDRPMRASFLVASVAAVLLSTATAAERYSGDAYSLAGDVLLYHETHYFSATGVERVVMYRCPDGRAFARKSVRESGDAQAPDFDLVDAHLGYREGVRERGAQREVYVQRRANMPEQTGLVRIPADGVIDAGFDPFAQRHWDALVRGDTLRFPYLVPSRRSFYNFKVTRVDDPVATAAGAMTLRLSLGAWFAFLLPHIDIVYDLASRHVVRYEGLSNIRDDNGWNYRVRSVYPAIASGPVAQDEIEAALRAPLTASCSAPDTAVSAAGQPATVPEVTTAARGRNQTP